MDRDRALDRLPPGYARALRLADDGWSVPAIATDLGLDPAAVISLLEIGAVKLARVMAEDLPPEDLPPDDPADGAGP